MKKLLVVMSFGFVQFISAQVGIGTQNPQGIFNVDGGKDNAATGAPTATQQANDFIVLSSGNVGIGTTSPSTKLDVNGVIKGRYGNLLEDQFGPILQNIYGLGGGNNDYLSISPTGTSSNLGIIFKTSDIDQASLAERVRIAPNGNVGIGLNPNAKLDVLSSSKEVARFVSSLATTNFAHIAIGNQSGAWTKLASGSGQFAIRNYSDDVSILLADLVTKNVGIGETTPLNRLVVKGVNKQPSALGTAQTNATLRVSGDTNHTLDFGTIVDAPYGAYIQSHNIIDAVKLPLSLNPSGGNVGIGTVSPDTSALLEVKSTTQGFLPPRVTQVERNAIANPATGLIVYCTNCNAGAGCLQTNDGTPASPVWNCLGGSSSSTPSVVGSCTGFSGNYFRNTAFTASNTYRVTFTNNSFSPVTVAFGIGDLAFSGASAANVSVASVSPASVTNLAAGASQVITYTLSGTPATLGTLVATWTKLTLSCSSNTTIGLVPPTFNCGGQTITANSFTLTNGTTYNGTVSILYTGGSTEDTFPAETLTQQGVTLTRTAGTYATSGNITYAISGTYTGTSNGTLTFQTDSKAGSCTIILFDIIRNAIVTGGNATDLTNYDAASVNSPISISQTSYDAIAAISGANRILTTEATMGLGASQGGVPSNKTKNMPAAAFESTYFSAGQFMVAFSLRAKSVTAFPTGRNYQNMKIKFSSNASSGYFDYTNSFPSLAATDQGRQFFVIKRPSNAIPTTPQMAIYNPNANNDLIGATNVPGISSTPEATGDSNTLGSSAGQNRFVLFQAIQIPTRQW